MIRTAAVMIPALLLCASSPAHALERQATWRWINSEPGFPGSWCVPAYHLVDAIQDTACWDLVWDWSGFQQGDRVGVLYAIGGECGSECVTLHQLRMYIPQALEGPGDEIQVAVYCADSLGCPAGSPLVSLVVDPDPHLNIIGMNDVSVQPCGAPGARRFLVTVCWLTDSGYPHMATDNMQSLPQLACSMPAGYPRAGGAAARSRAYLTSAACSPDCDWVPFTDDLDTLELVWRAALTCETTTVSPTSWGRLKSLYR
jgi:hypothetical protein